MWSVSVLCLTDSSDSNSKPWFFLLLSMPLSFLHRCTICVSKHRERCTFFPHFQQASLPQFAPPRVNLDLWIDFMSDRGYSSFRFNRKILYIDQSCNSFCLVSFRQCTPVRLTWFIVNKINFDCWSFITYVPYCTLTIRSTWTDKAFPKPENWAMKNFEFQKLYYLHCSYEISNNLTENMKIWKNTRLCLERFLPWLHFYTKFPFSVCSYPSLT